MTDPVEVSAADVREYLKGRAASCSNARAAAEFRSYAAAIARLEEREKRYREALEDMTDAVERMALRLDKEPGNQTVVALWMHKVNNARAALRGAAGQEG